jgi:hypothetical protein
VNAEGPAGPEVTEALAWGVGQVAPDGRSLQIVYGVSSGCPSGAPQPTLTETSTTITIGVQQATYPNENCPSLPYPAESIRDTTRRAGCRSEDRRIPAVPAESGGAATDPRQAWQARGPSHPASSRPRTRERASGDQDPRSSHPFLHGRSRDRTAAGRVAASIPGRVVVPDETIRVRLAGAGANTARCS